MAETFKNKIIRIESPPGNVLSKIQKQFNNYVRKIDLLKHGITDVRQQLDEIHRRVTTEIIPLEKRLLDKKAERVILWDKQYNNRTFSATQRKKIAHLIKEEAFTLIDLYGKEELKEIFDKYNDKTFEEENAEMNKYNGEMVKNMFEQLFGIELDENIDLSSPESIEADARQKLEAQQQAFEQKSQHKKTKAQLAKEEKKKEEEKNISQASRKVYMELVKEFHPDRENDETERERKTEVMQRVTNAYQANDLFELLRLQLDFFQIDETHINKLADEKLKYFNKVLRGQVQDLESELFSIKGFGDDLFSRFGGKPPVMDAKFSTAIKGLKQHIKVLDEEIKNMQDSEILKIYLKNYRISG
ncbi:MAG: hypothetical protein H7Y04_05770 [Verrucomicrobia bacterium]|nr:hypothetical protein [Cytophagales bacterium]